MEHYYIGNLRLDLAYMRVSSDDPCQVYSVSFDNHDSVSLTITKDTLNLEIHNSMGGSVGFIAEDHDQLFEQFHLFLVCNPRLCPMYEYLLHAVEGT